LIISYHPRTVISPKLILQIIKVSLNSRISYAEALSGLYYKYRTRISHTCVFRTWPGMDRGSEYQVHLGVAGQGEQRVIRGVNQPGQACSASLMGPAIDVALPTIHHDHLARDVVGPDQIHHRLGHIFG